MTLLFRFWHRGVLPALLLLAGSAAAQSIEVRPLGADPGRARYAPTAASRAAQRRTAALSLPFFDDFTTPLEGAPRADFWVQAGGTLVNNRFAINPLTRGAVTFDGLKADGTGYTNFPPNGGSPYSATDTLTSLPIDLAGFSTADQVFLSFAWQEGSLVGAPASSTSSSNVNFDLQFKASNGRWLSPTGWPKRPVGSNRQTLPFRQVVLPIDAAYLHGTFQFRFIATGRSAYAADTWSVDYVRLESGRGPNTATGALADTLTADVATSAGIDTFYHAGLSNPLRRYTAMPVWQYNAAPAGSELNPQLGIKAQNLNPPPPPLPTQWLGTVRDLSTGNTLGIWGNTTTNLLTRPVRVTDVVGDATQVPIPLTPEAKRLRYTLMLSSQETDARTLPNDTIFRDVTLSNYYAYDDGTPESAININAIATGVPSYFAYRFVANQADQVQALRLYPVFTADLATRSVTINVWADDNGHPAATALATKSFAINYPLPAGSRYVELAFDTPVPVTGTFYVGYGQPSQGRILEYAIDLNSRVPAQTFWKSVYGVWSEVARADLREGALMMQPVMNNNIISATTPIARDAAAFRLYPNPSRGSVSIEGPAFARATVLDALGRTAWEQPAAQAGQRQLELGLLPNGVYIVRLALPDGSVATRRLVVSQ